MQTLCTQCGQTLSPYYKVNGNGDVFCHDDCYDDYMDTHDDAPDDFNHPYIDDYDAVRFEYTEWLTWEMQLWRAAENGNITSEKRDIIESIASVIDEFYAYYQSEGDDGIFAAEIYRYLQKLEGIQQEVMAWKMD